MESGQRLQFGFVESYDKKSLYLGMVKVNGRELDPPQFMAFKEKPFRTYTTFQSFLLDPEVRVFVNERGRTVEVGRLRSSILRLWQDGYNCEIIGLTQGDKMHLLCPYNADTSDLRTFDYVFKMMGDGRLLALAG